MARTTAPEKANGKRHASQQSLNAAVKSICDIMRRSNCAGALQYVPELTWMLFLRILDEQENREAEEAAASGRMFKPSLPKPFRWRDWAAPESPLRQDKTASVWKFVHDELLPKLKNLENQPGANPRQKVISEIMSSVDAAGLIRKRIFATCWTRSMKSAASPWTTPTSSRSRRCMKGCC
jgi:type I restriction enzyme M protein